jgi:protein phosphatase
MAELTWGAGTHPGQIRPDNEDNLYASQGVYVVADGMGGHEAGEVASQIAVQRIRETLADEEAAPTAERVVEAISSANGDIFRAAIANPGQAGMGTTVTVLAIIEDPMAGRGEPNIEANDPIDLDRVTPIVPKQQPEALVLANVGDSRTYLLRHGRLRRVTVDHSYVQELVSTGHISNDEARTHPRRNIITRALGIEPDVKVDWWTLPLVRGDRFLLCTDGLVDEVADADIVATLLEHDDPQEAADSLITQANEAGGRDNVTVIVLDVLDGDDPPDPTQEIDLTPIWADDPAVTLDDIKRIEAGNLGGSSADPTEEVAVTAGRRQRRRDRRAAKERAMHAPAAVATTTVVTPRPSTPDEPADDADDASDSDTADSDDAPAPKKKRRLAKAIGIFVLLALLVTAFVSTAAWARRGFYVEFNNSDQVVLYQGRPGGFLWIDPTVEATGAATRDELTDASVALVEARPTFSSLSDATLFIRGLTMVEAEQAADDVPPTTADDGSP